MEALLLNSQMNEPLEIYHTSVILCLIFSPNFSLKEPIYLCIIMAIAHELIFQYIRFFTFLLH